jgi:spore coat polysaccharide biosynthesis predicted glycosyltransferase SpsG/RimJ/RimL family protein N-acetyltransferase
VTLRPAGAGDCRALWQWRNEESVRAVSFDPAVIPLEAHERWFAARLEDPRCVMFVVSVQGQDVGYVRFDGDGDEMLVSVALAPGVRGRGVGSAAIRLALRAMRVRHPGSRVVALIRPGNPRSEAAFRRAGFVAAGVRAVGDATAVAMAATAPGLARVLVAADGGPGIGLGHVTRSLALAAALERTGVWTGVLAPGRGPLRAPAEEAGLATVTTAEWPRWDEAGVVRLLELAGAHRADGIVVDSYRIGPAGLERLRRAPLRVVAIDDLALEAFPCHVVVNGGAAAPSLPYRSAHGDTRFLLGPEYALLRPVFWERGERKLRERPEHVLLSTGGTDPGGLAGRLLTALDRLTDDFSIDVVVGPFADAAAIQAEASRCRRAVRLHRDPSPACLRDLLLQADAAVSAAGQTLAELAWAGCPTVAFALVDNQSANLDAMAKVGAVRAVVTESADLPGWAAAELGRLLVDPDRRAAANRAGRALVDGRGALRVAAEIAR